MAYIEMRHISKRFGTVLANDDAGFSVERGEIVSLLGENGSGKSTLVNMLAGIYIPDSGSIRIDGKRRFFRSPQDAIAAGIGMVHQHFMLIPVMSAWENISLGEKAGPNPFIEKKRINRKIAEIEERFGLVTVHSKKIYDMSVSEKQTVEILKMLYRGASALVLDEPTAVLTPQETDQLFAMLRNMKQEGCAVVIITHKLNEVMEISDRVTVMRSGKEIGTVNTADTNPRELTEMMVGASISPEIRREKPAPKDRPALEVRDLSCLSGDGVTTLDDMSFELYGGEILGVAGIAGSGQKELCEIIAGLQKADRGQILCQGENLLGLSPREIADRGVSMSFIPEDRLGMGLVAGMSIVDNILLRSYEKRPGIFIDRAAGKALAEKIVARYGISTPSVQHVVRKLSGGNIQKVLLGREIDLSPKVLITAYPVRGLDIGASYSIYEMLNEQKKKGVAVLYIGEDLDVLRDLCDRLMVIHGGRLMAVVDPRETSKEDLGLLMLGQKAA
ncbi:MAG: ABC transporter ATP-binding protein [Treponema sp.]|jgi:simple sugar transport system ATP-binding protein|nr:ABC transporter ATP-binding protein [Treponema sp.]